VYQVAFSGNAMSLLGNFIKDIFQKKNEIETDVAKPKVLNVGGGSKSTPIPSYFTGWQHDLLDVDPRGAPDILCDARKLDTLQGGAYDAVYCSHNLEHYYRHHGLQVVRGFWHMLKANGFVEVRVPDIAQVIQLLADRSLDIDQTLYESGMGPISAHDVIYGLQNEIESSGNDFYAHKTGFTPASLEKLLVDGGFKNIVVKSDEHLAVHALAFKSEPTLDQCDFFHGIWDVKRPI
jgi:hypothetical protein